MAAEAEKKSEEQNALRESVTSTASESTSLSLYLQVADGEARDIEKSKARAGAAFEKAKAERVANLTARNDTLRTEIATVQAELGTVRGQLKSPTTAATTVQNHITLLHAYNDIKDIGQGLLGIIADNRNVRIADVHREFDVGSKD